MRPEPAAVGRRSAAKNAIPHKYGIAAQTRTGCLPGRSGCAASVLYVPSAAESPAAEPALRVLSLGGGVQSSTLALMADQDCFEHRPDAAVFADTQWEPPSTYEMVTWLQDTLSYPVHVVTQGSLPDLLADGVVREGGSTFMPVPAYTVTERPHQPLVTGMSKRICTHEFKITPLRRKMRALIGFGPTDRLPKGLQVELWLGMSFDEIGRMKDSDVGWVANVYPLIDERLTRRDCLKWWRTNAPAGAPTPGKSSCVGCPYHSTRHWAQLSRDHPDLITGAAEVERRMQKAARRSDPHVTHYLHRRHLPLTEAVARDRLEQTNLDAQGVLFDEPTIEECGGYCWT